MNPLGINLTEIPQKAVKIVTRPAEYFKEMPKAGGFGEPFFFATVMGLVTGIVYALLSLSGMDYGKTGITSGFGAIVFMPVACAVGNFVGAAIFFVIWKLLGSGENYVTAYRCGAYLAALTPVTAVITVIPYAGGIVNVAIYTYYMVVASIYVHNIPSRKAWIFFGILGVIFALVALNAEYLARNAL